MKTYRHKRYKRKDGSIKEVGIVGNPKGFTIVRGIKTKRVSKITNLNFRERYVEMKNFIVRLELRIGEYEKHTNIIVKAEDEYKAGEYAMYSESYCCDELDWRDEGVYDDYGGMYYCVDSVNELSETEFQTIRQYLPVRHYCQEDLDKAGNYKEIAK